MQNQNSLEAGKDLASATVESPHSALPRSVVPNDAPRYLVLGSDGNLGGYFRPTLLLCDVAANKREGELPRAIYKLRDGGMRLIYEPVTVEEIEAKYQEEK